MKANVKKIDNNKDIEFIYKKEAVKHRENRKARKAVKGK